jgi:hypothetical protein
MKARSWILRFVLALLALSAPSLWAQDGLGGALSVLGITDKLLHDQFSQKLVAADFDKDEKPDGAVLLDAGRHRGLRSFRIELHVTSHDNTALTFDSNETLLGIVALDVNQDGAPDIVVEETLTHKRLHIWLNDGHGAFKKARVEDYTTAVRDGPYRLGAPFLDQDYLALYLPTRIGSNSGIMKASAPSAADSAFGSLVLPVTSATQNETGAPAPCRGPPSLICL